MKWIICQMYNFVEDLLLHWDIPIAFNSKAKMSKKYWDFRWKYNPYA